MQICNEYLSNILFYSLTTEGTSEMLTLVQIAFKEPGLYRQFSKRLLE